MARLRLTDEQKAAVGAPDQRLFIEAAPGTGKTTVAAERFGVLRFTGPPHPEQSTTAVSFTRSATSELHRRVAVRWGSRALDWPNGVVTIDALICNIVQHLLRAGVIRWPGEHTSLQVLDDWRGHRGYRWLEVGSFRRVATIDVNGLVTSRSVPMRQAGLAIGSRDDFQSHLAAGRCTHEVVREVLGTALAVSATRDAIRRHLLGLVANLVVDEVFDANPLDLALVALVCETHIAITLVGDPWQALYGFRGATPELVPALLRDSGFATLPLSLSFRFQTDEMRQVSADLRERRPVSLARESDCDVVLASVWDRLWHGPDHVLPLSFGRRTNKTDAAAIVLLDYLVYSRFGQHAIFLPEALVLLDLDPELYRSQGASVLSSVAETLAKPDSDAPTRALKALRGVMRSLGAPRRPPSSSGDSEQRQIDRLRGLSLRLRAGRPLVPGMTIHQAKGREWRHVGVRFSDAEAARLASGLDPAVEGDRALYVALTRASHVVGLID